MTGGTHTHTGLGGSTGLDFGGGVEGNSKRADAQNNTRKMMSACARSVHTPSIRNECCARLQETAPAFTLCKTLSYSLFLPFFLSFFLAFHFFYFSSFIHSFIHSHSLAHSHLHTRIHTHLHTHTQSLTGLFSAAPQLFTE